MRKILPRHQDSIPGPSSRDIDYAIPAYKISEIPGNVMLERAEKINWSDRVRNEETRADWIGHILRRNCLLKHVMEGNIAGRM